MPETGGELTHSPERTTGDNPEFSRRLLVGAENPQMLDPHALTPAPNVEEIKTFEDRNYTRFNQRSEEERAKFWEGREDAREEWAHSTLAKFEAAKRFFEHTAKGKRWASTLSILGLDTQNMSAESIDQFYDKYLVVGSQEDEGIKKLLRDLFNSGHFDTDGRIDIEKVRQNRDVIEWISTSEGIESAQVAAALFEAESRLKSAPDTLKSSDKGLAPTESQLLAFVRGIQPEATPPPNRTEARSTNSAPESESTTERRLANQESYLRRIKERYTVERMNRYVYIAREAKDPITGREIKGEEYIKASKEAKRLQALLYALNKEPKDYLGELEEMNNTLPPMNEETKFSIIIPAYREEARIAKTLSGWIEQKNHDGSEINPAEIEILILVNKPNNTREYDNTLPVIEEFKTQHPQFADSIQVVQKSFNFEDVESVDKNGNTVRRPDVSMGLIYRYATDLALVRSNQRRGGKNNERVANHIIRTGGADVVARSPHHIANILAAFDDENVEQYVSLSDYHPDIYKKIPLLFVARNVQEHLNEALTRGLSNIGLGTYRASLYTEAGGFEQAVKVAEEIELSKRMKNALRARKALTTGRKRDHKLNAIDDPKREIATLFSGRPITQAYSDFATNTQIASIDLRQIVDSPLPGVAELTPENLERELNALLQAYLKQFYAPDQGYAASITAETTINHLLEGLEMAGIERSSVKIMFEESEYTPEMFSKHIRDNTSKIDNTWSKFSVSVTHIPDIDVISRLHHSYSAIDGDWVFDLPPLGQPALNNAN